MKVLVVGGGAAGLMAAGAALRQGHEVTVLEHMEKPAQKILVTGKGRCNVTNDCTAEEFLHHVRTNPRFLFSSLGAFPPARTMELFESLGVELKVERGRRVFPVSDKAEEIRQALLRYADGADIVHDGAKKLLLEPLAQPEEAPAAAYDGRRFFLILQGLHQLDDCHLSSISPAGAGAGHSGVAAVAVSVLGSDLLEQLVGNVFLGDERQRLTVSCQVALLAQSNHFLNHRLDFLGTIEGGLHLAIGQQVGYLLTQQGLSLCAGFTQLTSAEHERFLLF